MTMTSEAPQGVRMVPRRTIEVCQGMSIQVAIDAAAAQVPAPSAANPWTIYIYPGIYTETITCISYVHLRGVGPKGSVVIFQEDSSGIVVVRTNELENFTIRLGTPTAGHTILEDTIFGWTARLTDIVFECTNPGAQAIAMMHWIGPGDYTLERCSYNIGGTGAANLIMNINNPATIRLLDCDFRCTNLAANHIYSNQAGTWYIKGTRWSGNSHLLSVLAGTFYFDNCPILTGRGWSVTGGTLTFGNCRIDEVWTTITNCTLRLFNCSLREAQAGNGAIVRLRNCYYRQVIRTGTGNIVDESPQLQDAPWHVQKWSWQAALANSQVAVRGTPIDGGSGQVLLEVTLNVATQEAVEQLPEAGGARDNSLIPLRTPRMLAQFIWDRTGANEFVFFGLRETLGNAYPAAAEESAGFHYDSATGFVARSSTAAGDEDTVMGLAPGHTVVTQLEIIIFGGVRVEFYIDGVLVASHATRVPTANLRWQHLLYTDGLGAVTDVNVEILNGGCQQCPDSVP